jgi:hypothetical protein
VSDSSLLDGVLGKWAVVALLFVSLAALLPLVALVFQLGGFHAMLGTPNNDRIIFNNLASYACYSCGVLLLLSSL